MQLELRGFRNNKMSLRGSWSKVLKTLAEVLKEDGLNHNTGS
jgi:hypothetical protein